MAKLETSAAPIAAASASAESFEPYISSETRMRELTPRAVISGAILGVIFGASSLYLVLKVGLTVSASIPVAVISITMFRILSKLGMRDATILENNMVQTTGSAGESIAFGLGVTMPAIMVLGATLELPRIMLVAVLGGLLGVLMMIPLRRALIVAQHGTLKYPEGTACAVVLKAGASAESRSMASASYQAERKKASEAGLKEGTSARAIFAGFGIGIVYKTVMSAFKAWKDIPEKIFAAPYQGGSLSVEIAPELLGIGYIIGFRISAIMCGGGVLAFLVLIPMIKFFGEGLTQPLSPGKELIRNMGPQDIRDAYVLYIGAGAVAAGGIISVFRSLPMIWNGLREGLRDFGLRSRPPGQARRTDKDLSMQFVLGGIVLLIVAIWASPSLHMNLIGALLIIIFGFLFVTVSSRLTGEIGSSSNPISGMTVATLLLTCLIFLLIGWTGSNYYVTALSVGAIVCIAASNGGTTSQDLKTGYLVGATPRLQQMGLLVGVLASAVLLGPILMVLNQAATVYVPISEVAPGLRTDPTRLHQTMRLEGPQSRTDENTYKVWHKTDTGGGRDGIYLVDEAGNAVYYVDPGINGQRTKRPDGTEVRKFAAPKAVLMSYIIKGILDRQLPWGLVLFGVMISIVLELSGIPSLAFAVGVYLPLSASTPIFIGGFIRWVIDYKRRAELKGQQVTLSEEQLAAEGDRSPGVLMSSGYIAGGAIAGIIIAIVAAFFHRLDSGITEWATAHNPFYQGPYADLLALIPFSILIFLLYFVGREKLFASRSLQS